MELNKINTYKNMFIITSDLARIQEEIIPYPQNEKNINIWQNTFHSSLKNIIKDLDIIEKDKDKIIKIESLLFNLYDSFYKYASLRLSIEEINKRLQLIFDKHQVEQRSLQWYEDMKTMLTASEFSKLFSGELTYGRLVFSKVNPEPRNNRLAITTEFMLPTDWGIRFEPVIKSYLEKLWNCTIYDSGRLRHDEHKNGASPDGIIIETNSEKYGRLVEIKCPYSRKIENKKIPEDYWIQMQIQMEVTNLMECEFVEIEILSKTPKNLDPNFNITNLEKGKIYLLEKDNILSYCYDKEPNTNEYRLVEEIEYALINMNNVLVQRDTKWYESTIEKQNLFWEDVEKAKKGEFLLPESKRKKMNICLIKEE
jgi:hypothetical protein